MLVPQEAVNLSVESRLLLCGFLRGEERTAKSGEYEKISTASRQSDAALFPAKAQLCARLSDMWYAYGALVHAVGKKR